MPDTPTLSLAAVQSTVGSATRWKILRELADGGSLMNSELAHRLGSNASAISKQLSALIAHGIVRNPRGRLFEIKPEFIADKTERVVDFGWCLLRLNQTPAPA